MQIAMLSAVTCVILASCASAPRRTMLTIEDYAFIADEIAAKLQADLSTGPLASRTSGSPPMVISVQKVVNLTSDLLPTSIRRALVVRVKDSLPKVLLEEKNIQFVIPMELVRAGAGTREWEEGSFTERRPTHHMTVKFRSVTRTAEKQRTESYLCDYQITALSSGELVWSDQVEFKRWAEGRLWD